MSSFAMLTCAVRRSGVVAALALLSACGGGEGPGTKANQDTGLDSRSAQAQAVAVAPSGNEARRFLTQATFGPVDADVLRVQQLGYEGWLNEQIGKAAQTGQHLTFFNARLAEKRLQDKSAAKDRDWVIHSHWKSFLGNPDQLRQRVSFALSQVFVVSFGNDCLAANPQAVASFADMLASNAFGSYRKLLEDVARHPAMGCYLSHLRNQKEDAATGRQPDENFAREIMQLFSIGVHRLNKDGTPVLGGTGEAIETYTSSDVKGLAKVFTGLSFSCTSTSAACFGRGVDSPTGEGPDEIWTRPMVFYPAYHSTSEKQFLGVKIGAGTSTPDAELRLALDTLAGHPNVAPFMSRQLIQRLVTSNPSKEYVARVAGVFTTSGGKLGDVVKAILLDPEARTLPGAEPTIQGKLREPLLRFTALARLTGVNSRTGGYKIGRWMPATASLGQLPFLAPSVFNFHRPGYSPAGSDIALAGKVAPEFQQFDEASFASHANFINAFLQSGAGDVVAYADTRLRPDTRPLYLDQSGTAIQVAVANGNVALINFLDEQLLHGTMSAQLRTLLSQELGRLVIPRRPTAEQVRVVQEQKIRYALLLVAVSPDFLIQR